MHNIENNDFGSDLDRDLSGPVFSSPQNIPNPNTTLLTLEENPSLTRSSTSSMQAEEKCTICSATPAWIDGPNVYPTCGRACANQLLIACGGQPITDEPPTSDPPNMSSANDLDTNREESPRRTPELTRTPVDTSIKMCEICNVLPAYRDGPRVFPLCGMPSCAAKAAKLLAASNLPNANEPPTSDSPNKSSAPIAFDKDLESPRQSPATQNYADWSLERCVICNGPLRHRDDPDIYPACGRACASKLRAYADLPNTNEPRISDPPHKSSAPNVFDKDWDSPRRTSEPTQTYADRSDLPDTNEPLTSDPPNKSSTPNVFDKGRESPRWPPTTRTYSNTSSVEMCVICKAPAYRDGPNNLPTCGLTCAFKLLPNTNRSPTSDSPNKSSAPNVFDKGLESPRRLPTPRTHSDRSVEICVICKGAPAYRDGPNDFPTCGMACASKLRGTSGQPNTNRSPTSDSPKKSSAPNISDKDRESSRQTAERTRTYAEKSMDMCVICNVAPVYSDGTFVYPTCGIKCYSTLRDACDLPNTNKPRTTDPPNISSALNIIDENWEPSRRTPEPTRAYFDSSIELCVVCRDAPASRAGPNIYPTCGKACASKLLATSDPPNTNKPPTWDPPNSAFLSSEPPQVNADITRSHSRPNQIGMCDVCHIRARYQRGSIIYPTCGNSCAAKLCDYCNKRPKVVIDGKMYPQCGKTCRDKAKAAILAKIGCILCKKLTKEGESDFCSRCESLANDKAPFLIEIPRGHVAFEKVAALFTSEWQSFEMRCPTIKRVCMVVTKKSSQKSFDKYRTSLGSRNILLQRKKWTSSLRWLDFRCECGFGDPGIVEPCCSSECFLCSIVRSSFNRSDFPLGITTSGLNRTVELSRSGKGSSSKIVVLTRVTVGREAEMSPGDVQVARPLPPPDADAVHVIGVRKDGSRLDLGDIIVYDGDAVWPVYLISYE